MIKNMIGPFVWMELEGGRGGVSLSAGTYRENFFQKYSDEFEDGSGNGYDWEFFAERYLESCFPEMTESICFDSEAEEFCMYSDEKTVLEEFAKELKRVTDDAEVMEEVWGVISMSSKVYVAAEKVSAEGSALSYVGVTALSLEDRLKQHQSVGRDFVGLALVEEVPETFMARGYEEVIEEMMSDPSLNEGHLFRNENNSIHPYGDEAMYEDATTWAVKNMRQRGHMSSEGRLVVLDRVSEEAKRKGLCATGDNSNQNSGQNNSIRGDLDMSNSGMGNSHKKNEDEVDAGLTPFFVMELENGMFSVYLDTTSYKKEIFSVRNEDGIMGSGYDWNKVAGTLLRELGMHRFGDIFFESEADLFCAYAKGAEGLTEFAGELKKLCENDMELGRIVNSI